MMLMSNGMSETQANEVMSEAVPHLKSLDDDYTISFERAYNEYPENLYLLWYEEIKPIALKWIEENKPQAWFKPMFQ